MTPELSVDRWARATPRAPALVMEGRTIDWTTLAGLVDRVVLDAEPPCFCAENSLDLVVSILACLRARRPFALLHPRLAPAERAEQLAFWRSHADRVPTGTAAVLFTSGTSGRAKAACLPAAAFVASARATLAHLGAERMQRWLLALPLCHVGGLSILTRALTLGSAVVLPRDGSAAELLASARHGLTGASLVPTQLRRLVEQDVSLRELGTLVLGGAPAPAALLTSATALGARALCTYGMTETCSQIALEIPEATDVRSSGVLLAGAEAEVRDERGAVLAAGDVGMLWVRGPSLFAGYLGRGSATAEDGWFETGDLGWFDRERRLHIESRRTDLIVSGGENVYPLEVERALLECPLVKEALVFGAVDAEWGQQVRALLVVRRADDVLVHLADHLRDRLARYKWPRQVAIVPTLPTTPLGKPDRRAAGAVVATFTPLPRP